MMTEEGKSLNKMLPIFVYSVATFFLMDFAFFINNIVNTLHFTYFESFILLGIPFIGRMITPFVYSPLAKIGVPRLALLSVSIMALISFGMAYEGLFIELFLSRFVIGIMFGVATSAAIEVSSFTKNRVVIGLTMGGWAIGWIIAAILFMFLKSWTLVSLVGVVFLPAFIFSKKHNIISPHVRKFHFDFSISVFIVFLLGFTPAYILEVVPTYLGSSSFVESIVAYSIAIVPYLVLPYLVNRFSITRIVYSTLFVILVSGILFFLTGNLIMIVIFTAFGLGMNSLLPIISGKLHIGPEKIGPSMNFSAISGFLLPLIITVGIEYLNIIVAILLSSVGMLIFIDLEFNRRSPKRNSGKKLKYNLMR